MNEKYWYLKNCPLFRSLSSEELQTVESECYSRSFNRGELVYLPGDMSDAVLLLARGRIRMYHVNPEGKQAVLGFIDRGELFGELTVFDDRVREEYAEAVDKSFVVLIPRQTMQRLMQDHADLTLGLTRLFGFRIRRIERRLKSLLFRSIRDRLVHLLLELAERYGRQTNDGLLLDLRISHQEMASVIGSTRETVTITLGELQEDGFLQIQRRKVVLRRIDQMASMVDFGPVRLVGLP